MSNAILENMTDIVEKLLNDESINFGQRINNRDTYIHLAINGNSVTPIHLLLLNHHSIDINATNVFNEAPLVKDVKFENKEQIELIMYHPKFNASLSNLNYAFMLSVKSKEIFMMLIKSDSLDDNYLYMY